MDIKNLIERAVRLLQEQRYTSNRIYTYRWLWSKGIIPFMEAKGLDDYDEEVGKAFMLTCHDGGYLDFHHRDLVKSADILTNVLLHDTICRKEGASMNNPFDYKGVFAPYMDGYVNMMESCGFKILNTKWFFKKFDRFTLEYGLESSDLTQELVDAWAKTRINDCSRTLSEKYSHLSQLGRYMNEHGIRAFITPLPKCTNSRGFTPYIFSESQMHDIFNESDRLIRESHRISCQRKSFGHILVKEYFKITKILKVISEIFFTHALCASLSCEYDMNSILDIH